MVKRKYLLGMERKYLQAIAQGKLDDAILLLKNRRFSNAYYLAGYAIEIGLKACIARQIAAETIPDKDFVNQIFQHNFNTLINLAGLTQQLKEKETKDLTFNTNWALIAEWNPEKRYESIDSYSAQLLIEAITNEKSGVFQWIKQYW